MVIDFTIYCSVTLLHYSFKKLGGIMKTTLLLTLFTLAALLLQGQWTYTNLSAPRDYMGATVLGSKAYFAGGSNDSGLLSTVEIYDAQTGDWNTSYNLSVARECPFAVACGSKVLFAGGADFYITGDVFSTVDIYDTIDSTWTVEQLSVPRLQAAVVSHGNKVLFAGGVNLQQGLVYDIVDIYDIETGEWSTDSLSEPRVVWWAKVGDLAIFAGGYDLLNSSKRVDIYNFTTDTWSIDSLSVPRAFIGMTTIGNKVLIAGGMTSGNNASNVVDIYDASTGQWSTANLSQARAFCDNQNAVTSSGKAYFVGGGIINLNGAYWTTAYNVIDIYDEATNSWSVDYMPIPPRIHHAVVATGNKVIIAGGYIYIPPYGCDSIVAIYTCPSSSCLPEGITFTTQEEIDNFQANYPGCTEIEGDVTINGGTINNLNGLNVLTSIGGNFEIDNVSPLVTLTGLDALTFIGGGLVINGTEITDLTGLSSLTYIGGCFRIGSGGMSGVGGNPYLTSLTGIEALTTISDILTIQRNPSLISLTGLSNLISVGGLIIIENNAITSLTGLDNIDEGSIDYLGIYGNNSLASCDIQGICYYLSNPNGSVNIFGNASGCNNPSEVALGCGISLPCLPFGNYYFINQTDVDNFQSNYPACTELSGNVLIGIDEEWYLSITSDISNLNGLLGIKSIEGRLWITTWNNGLTTLAGLDSLNSIGGELYISDNSALSNFVSLGTLTSIGGELTIYSNNSLTSLTGLDNIEANSIESINIQWNSSLSNCDVLSICDYLASPGGIVEIEDNAPGCNSPDEVEEACFNSVEEINTRNGISIIPNPSNNKITISSPAITGNTLLSIFNVSGKKVIEKQLTDNETQIDISALPRGVYFVRLQNENMVEIGKIVKE
jgi:N-acetylneuraminic acid mutarotase